MLKISEFMDKDHVYLNILLTHFLEECKKTESLLKVRKLFEKFKRNLLTHMELEDEVLFPRLSACLGFEVDCPLTRRARNDHAKILKLTDLIEKALEKQDAKKVFSVGDNLKHAIEAHHDREKEIHYPVSDKFIKKVEWLIFLRNFEMKRKY